MFSLRPIFVGALALFWTLACGGAEQHPAASLTQRIAALLDAFPADAHATRTVEIVTPAQRLVELCPTPALSLTGSTHRLTGKKTLTARCGARRVFIQVVVHAEGNWWVATRALMPGKSIQPEDIALRTGSLDQQPEGMIFSKEQILGQTVSRSIRAGQTIVQNQLRRPWVIISGQEVDVVAQGEGFLVRSRGKALDSASLNAPLRIATRTGQIITGVAAAKGKVAISLKE